ncbi:unnamed protein product [Effrenium voratum]|uniref:Ion transport domain-containing protein n=1 Tax=Effrenium voratum TaxID=2562239 RepID=A0AA36I5W0_9DINO|nr:unnamed protein product [Effrenium voratum]
MAHDAAAPLAERDAARIRQIAVSSMIQATAQQKLLIANRAKVRRSAELLELEIGDLVEIFRRPTTKDASGWVGPATVSDLSSLREGIVYVRWQGSHQIPCGFYVMLWKLNEEKLYGLAGSSREHAGFRVKETGTMRRCSMPDSMLPECVRFGHGVNGLPATVYDDTLIVWWQCGDLRRWNHCFITGAKYISLERLTEQKQVAFVQYFMVDDEEVRQLRTQVDDTPHIGGPHEPQAPELVEVKDKDLVRKRKVRAIVDAQPAPGEPGEEEHAASQNAAESEEPDVPGSEPERGTAFVSAVPAVADFMEMPEVTNAGELQEAAELELTYGVLVYTTGNIRKLMSQMRKQDTALVLLSNDKPFAAIEREHNVLTREEALANAERCRESMVQELQRWIKHKSWCRTAKHGQKNILRSKWVLKWKAVENADKKIKELAEAGEDRREVALELPPGGETLLRMQPGYEDFNPEVEVLRRALAEIGVTPTTIDPQTFVRHERGCLVLVLTVHVDDLKLCGEDKIVKIVIAKLEDRFESMKVEKGNFTHLGLKHETSADGMVTISQEHYIRELRLIPEEELKLQPKEQLVGPDYHKYYMSLLGGVAWTTEDLLKLNRLVRYIKQNPLKLVYHKITGPLKLMAITDSAYRGEDQDHLAVRSGLIVLISAKGPVVGNNPIQILEYISKKQSRVCRSTFTAELYSALDMVGLGLNICMMVNEITNGVQSAAHMADKLECGKITEGLDVAIDADAVFRALAAKEVKTPTDAIMLIHALKFKEWLKTGQVKSLMWIDTRDMLADALNKGSIDRAALRTAAEEGIWKIEHAFKTHQENIKQAEICTAVTIMVYALFIGVELEIETNYPEAAQHMAIALLVCHVLFNIIFIVELVLRLRSVGLRYCSPFNPVGFFDTLIILIGTGETLFSVVLAMMSQDNAGSVMAIAGVMRILRLLRLARLLRGFLVCHELRLLVTGMILALPTVLWAGVLFGIVVYLGTMFSVILLGNVEELHDYFGTFGLALWSHFVIVTMETWPDIADAVLEVASPLWGLYFVVFICVSSMSLMNLVTGVIAEKLITTRDEPMPEGPRDEQEVFQKEKAALKADLSALLLDEVDIDVDLFGGLLETPTLRTWLHKLQVSSELPAHELYELISSGVKEHLSLDELVEGLFFLRGSSLRVHSLLLQQDLSGISGLGAVASGFGFTCTRRKVRKRTCAATARRSWRASRSCRRRCGRRPRRSSARCRRPLSRSSPKSGFVRTTTTPQTKGCSARPGKRRSRTWSAWRRSWSR